MTAPPPPAHEAAKPTGEPRVPLWKHPVPVYVLAATVVVAAVASGAAGALITRGNYEPVLSATQQDYERVVAARDSAERRVIALEADMGRVDAQREQADKRAADLDEREKTLEEREQAVSAEENRIAANTFSNGVYRIGTDIEPGTYRTDNAVGDSCYYAWMSGTGSNADIVDNNIIRGPGTVTLRDGEIFEASRCTWTKID